MRIGCDIVAIARVRRALERTSAFPNFLTEAEYALFVSKHGERQAEWLAGRFCGQGGRHQGNARDPGADAFRGGDPCG